MEQEQDFEGLKEEYTNTVLELQHYKERVTEQEDKIAKLRVEVTRLSNAYQTVLNQQQEAPNVQVDPPVEEPIDAEVVTD